MIGVYGYLTWDVRDTLQAWRLSIRDFAGFRFVFVFVLHHRKMSREGKVGIRLHPSRKLLKLGVLFLVVSGWPFRLLLVGAFSPRAETVRMIYVWKLYLAGCQERASCDFD